MNVKKIWILMMTAIILVACGNETELPKKQQNKVEHKESAADIARKKIKESREKKKSQSKKDENKSETSTTEAPTTETVQKENVNNIKSRSVLSQIIYSNNYTVTEKMAAYQSGVANGVIPQGTNTSSPAAAFESALQVERAGTQSTETPSTETPSTESVDPATGLPVQQ